MIDFLHLLLTVRNALAQQVVYHNATSTAGPAYSLPPGFVGIKKSLLTEIWGLMFLGIGMGVLIPALILYFEGPQGRKFLGYRKRMALIVSRSGNYDFAKAKLQSDALVVENRREHRSFLMMKGSAYTNPGGPQLYVVDAGSGTALSAQAAHYAARLDTLNVRRGPQGTFEVTPRLVGPNGKEKREPFALIGFKPMLVHYYAGKLEKLRSEALAAINELDQRLEKQKAKLDETKEKAGLLKLQEELTILERQLADQEKFVEFAQQAKTRHGLEVTRAMVEARRNDTAAKIAAVEASLAPIQAELAQLSQERGDWQERYERWNAQLERAQKADATGNFAEFSQTELSDIAEMLRNEPEEVLGQYVSGEAFDLRVFADYCLSQNSGSNLWEYGQANRALGRASAPKGGNNTLLIIGVVVIIVIFVIGLLLGTHSGTPTKVP